MSFTLPSVRMKRNGIADPIHAHQLNLRVVPPRVTPDLLIFLPFCNRARVDAPHMVASMASVSKSGSCSTHALTIRAQHPSWPTDGSGVKTLFICQTRVSEVAPLRSGASRTQGTHRRKADCHRPTPPVPPYPLHSPFYPPPRAGREVPRRIKKNRLPQLRILNHTFAKPARGSPVMSQDLGIFASRLLISLDRITSAAARIISPPTSKKPAGSFPITVLLRPAPKRPKLRRAIAGKNPARQYSLCRLWRGRSRSMVFFQCRRDCRDPVSRP